MTNKELEQIKEGYFLNYLKNNSGKKQNLEGSICFFAGWEACLQELDRQKVLKDNKKQGKIDLMQFARQGLYRLFMNGVYHDKGFKIATDGRILAMIKDSYPEVMEGKIFDYKLNKELEGQFPNYQRVIPDTKDRVKKNIFTVDDLKVVTALSKKKRNSDWCVMFDEKYIFSLSILRRVLSFWLAYPNAKLWVSEKESSNGVVNESAMLKDGENICVFMGYADFVGKRFSYDSEKKMCIDKTEN